MRQPDDRVAGALITEIRRESGLTQSELSRRTGLQRSVLSAYEHARRQPSVAALARIAEAAGLEIRLAPSSDREASVHAGQVLGQVLDLAESLPYRPSRELRYPPLIRLAR
ncbi:MAG: helix-turn-helix transcriptional regulator [Solirubrobacterales bacterium]|nr:helix-turn-helix transcriptional regulator [Solirubrobacterales bacterium]